MLEFGGGFFSFANLVFFRFSGVIIQDGDDAPLSRCLNTLFHLFIWHLMRRPSCLAIFSFLFLYCLQEMESLHCAVLLSTTIPPGLISLYLPPQEPFLFSHFVFFRTRGDWRGREESRLGPSEWGKKARMRIHTFVFCVLCTVGLMDGVLYRMGWMSYHPNYPASVSFFPPRLAYFLSPGPHLVGWSK